MGVIQKRDKKVIQSGTTITGTGPHPPFINPLPTTATNLAGIPAGTTFPLPGTAWNAMWNLLLYPFIVPTFTAFWLDDGFGAGWALIECGDSVNSPNQVFIWATSTPANIDDGIAGSLQIQDSTGGIIVADSLFDTGTTTVDYSGGGVLVPITNNVMATNTWTIYGLSTNLPPDSFTRNWTSYWNWSLYVGDQAGAGNLNQAQIMALALYNYVGTSMANSAFGNYIFPAAATYKTLCFPVAPDWNQPATFKDLATGFNVPMQAPYVVAVTNAFGQTENYNCYRTTNIIGGAITIIVA